MSSSSESEEANAAAGGGEQEREDQENRPSTSSSCGKTRRHPRPPLHQPDSPQQELQQHGEAQASQEQKLQHEREKRRQRAERRRDQRPVQEGQAAEDPHGRDGEASQEPVAAAAQHEISSDELLRAIEESAQGILAPFAAPLEAARGAAADLRKLSAAAEALECHAPQEEERRGLLLRLLGRGAARLDESADGGEEEEAEASIRKRRNEEGEEGSGGASAEKRRRRAEERGEEEEGIAGPEAPSTANDGGAAGVDGSDDRSPVGSDGREVHRSIGKRTCCLWLAGI